MSAVVVCLLSVFRGKRDRITLYLLREYDGKKFYDSILLRASFIPHPYIHLYLLFMGNLNIFCAE